MLKDMKTFSVAAWTLIGALLLVNPASIPVVPAAPGLEPGAARSGWLWPLNPEPEVLAPFAPPAQRWLSGHRGADLAANPGDTVVAPAGGIVSFVGVIVDRPVVVVDHGAGLKSSFEPLRSELSPGSIVGAGDGIGMVGSGAHCDRRCLHWGLRLNGEYIDPLLTIRDDRPSILLPQP